MTRLRHPHLTPEVDVDVEPEKVASYLASGWLPLNDDAPAPEADEPPADTTERPRRRRAGSDSQEETAP